MEEKKELTKIDQPGNMPVQLDALTLAIEKGADLNQIEKLMELQEKYDAREARKAYVVAMAAFKADPPKIDKDASVKYGQTAYKHATLGNVTDKINKGLSKQGLSAAWQTEQKEKTIAVTCKITHILGHSESTTLEAGADTSGAKNSIQAIGSTITYLQRYTLLSLAGLATEEMDDDGAGSEAEYIDDEQMATLNEWIESTKTDLAKFKKYLGVDGLDKLLVKDYKKALNALKSKEKTGAKK